LKDHISILALQKSFAGVIDFKEGDATDGAALKEDKV
jgi:hypothetical protein